MSKSMEKRLRAQRPIVLADIEHTFAGDRAPDVLALCAALRELADYEELWTADPQIFMERVKAVLARHNIVLDAEDA